VALSGGSACSSHSLEPSRVLTRLGIERDLALCSLRISIGRYTTEEDVRGILAAFDRVVNWG
jgi:cysteine desulfurase